MAGNPIDKIAALLGDDDPEKRIAAAIVLGELRAKLPAALKGLSTMLTEGGPVQQRHALEALARIGAGKAVPQILPLLGAREDAVRGAAVAALASVGDSVIKQVEARIPAAGPDERRALDAVLAQLGGKDAFNALLQSLDDADDDSAGAAAVAMRARIREADGKQRRGYLTEIERFLVRQAKKTEGSPAAVRGALKILGYLEDPKAVDTLLDYARAKKQPASVRQEALIALRFTAKSPDAKLIGALAQAAEDPDRTLAQTALITLGALELPGKVASRLASLVAHPDVERAAFVIDMLGHRKGEEAAEVLVSVLEEQEPRRVELAARALREREDAIPALVNALASTEDPERAKQMRNVLRPMAGKLKPPQVRKLLDAAIDRLGDGERGWESAIDVAREADPKKTAEALRDLADKMKKGRKPDIAARVLRVVCRSEHATDADRYELASLSLRTSRKDTRKQARDADESLSLISTLLRHGFDVLAALRRDRSVGLEEMYYLGFHFIEQDHPLGEELLSEVAKEGGKKKIGRMARNKLELANQSG